MTKKSGPPSHEELYGEPFTALRFQLPQSQHEALREISNRNHVPMAEYLRSLIEYAVKRNLSIIDMSTYEEELPY
jgi:hypothetical protein